MSRQQNSLFDAFGGTITTLLSKVHEANDGQCSMDIWTDILVMLTQRTRNVFDDFLRKSNYFEDSQNASRIKAMSSDIEHLIAKLKAYTPASAAGIPLDRASAAGMPLDDSAAVSLEAETPATTIRTRSQTRASTAMAVEEADEPAATIAVRKRPRIVVRRLTAKELNVVANDRNVDANNRNLQGKEKSSTSPGSTTSVTTRAMKRKINVIDTSSANGAPATKRECVQNTAAESSGSAMVAGFSTASTAAKATRQRIVYDLDTSSSSKPTAGRSRLEQYSTSVAGSSRNNLAVVPATTSGRLHQNPFKSLRIRLDRGTSQEEPLPQDPLHQARLHQSQLPVRIHQDQLHQPQLHQPLPLQDQLDENDRDRLHQGPQPNHVHQNPDLDLDEPSCRRDSPQLTDDMVEMLRDRRITYTIDAAQPKQIRGLCVICGIKQSLVLADWKLHLLAHTNEKYWFCRTCHKQYDEQSMRCTSCLQTHVVSAFGRTSRQCELNGLLCNECNVVKVAKESMRRHIVAAHPHLIPTDSSVQLMDTNCYDLIQLIPDMQQLVHQPIYQRIVTAQLYSCTICHRYFNDSLELYDHLRTAHEFQDRYERHGPAFRCRHCTTSIFNWSAVRVVKHIMLHAPAAFKCGVCRLGAETHKRMVDHVITSHPNAQRLRIFHYVRDNDGHQFSQLAEHTVLIKCRSCNMHFESMRDVQQHIADVHRSRNIHFSLIEWIKSTMVDGTAKYRMREAYIPIKQAFECRRCDFPVGTKEQLVQHHVQHHAGDSIAVNVKETMHMAGIEFDDCSQNERNLAIDRNVMFVCVHCFKADGKERAYYATVAAVSSHWIEEHSENRLLDGAGEDELTALSLMDILKEEPGAAGPSSSCLNQRQRFQFYADELMECFYCDVISTHQGLREHHIQAHPTEQFAMRSSDREDQKPYSPHFQCNPKAFSAQFLDHLRTIDGPAKYRCLHCKGYFDTNQLYTNHHSQMHAHLLWSYERQSSNPKMDYCIAGCCSKQINTDELMRHLNTVKHSFDCNQCTFKTNGAYKMAKHNVDKHQLAENAIEMYKSFMLNVFWKTEFVFGNGLVVNQNNLRPTEFFQWTPYGTFMANTIVGKERTGERRTARPVDEGGIEGVAPVVEIEEVNNQLGD